MAIPSDVPYRKLVFVIADHTLTRMSACIVSCRVCDRHEVAKAASGLITERGWMGFTLQSFLSITIFALKQCFLSNARFLAVT